MVSRADRGPLADWFWTIDRFFLAAFIMLMGIGFMLSFAASPAVAERIGLQPFHFVERHALFIIPSVIVMIGLSFLTPRQVRRTAIILLAASLVLMVLALFFGVEVKGARRWIGVGALSIQPSEFMKPAFVVVCAWLFSEHARQPEIPGNLFAILLFAIVGALLIAQPDLGQTVLTSVVWGGMFFAFIVLRGLNHAFKERNDFNRFAVAGLVLQIGIQSMINIGVNLQLMPAKGMTLPLISYGGSSQVAICITAGFILALTRHRPEKRAQERSLFRVSQGVPAE